MLSRSNVLGIPTPGSSGRCLPDQVSYTEVWHYSYHRQLIMVLFVLALIHTLLTLLSLTHNFYEKQLAD